MRKRVFLLGVVCSLLPGKASAGGEMPEPSAAERRAESLTRAWSKAGPSAAREVARRLCDGASPIHAAAFEQLEKWGPASVSALLATKECDGEIPGPDSVLSRILCPNPEGASEVVPPIVAALNGKNVRARSNALGALLSEASCAAADQAAQKGSAGIAEVLRAGDRADVTTALRVLAQRHALAAPLVGAVRALVHTDELGDLAIIALGANRVSDAESVEVVRSQLRGTGLRKTRAMDALSEMATGPERSVVLADAIAMVDEGLGRPCDEERAQMLESGIAAVTKLADVDYQRADKAVLAAESDSIRKCGIVPSALWTGLNRLGPAAQAEAQSVILHEDTLPLELRLSAADFLEERKALKPEDRPLLEALSAQARPTMERVTTVQVLAAPTAEDTALRSVNACRRAVGMEPLEVKLKGAREQLDAVTTCFERTLCGPGRERYASAMNQCCEKAFGNARPGWCTP